MKLTSRPDVRIVEYFIQVDDAHLAVEADSVPMRSLAG